MASTVHVKGIHAQTSEKEVRDFFSFCGKISSLSLTPDSAATDATKSASVTFEKETAAKTALLLDNTQLGAAQVSVSGAASLDQIAPGKTAGHADDTTGKDDVAQEDKPRSRIAAEYLAHGYKLSDIAIQRALDLDKQHGISQRFTTALTQFDSKYKVTERAAATDKQYGVSQRANQGWASLSSYFEQAASTPTGQRLRNFYDQSQKQVLDVHNEARHLAGLSAGNKDMGMHNVEGSDRTKCQCGADSSSCPCAPGTCACNNCAKNPDQKTSSVSAEQAEMEKVTVDGKEKTKCNCGGADGKCPCEPGKCSCSGCSKAS
nr:protein vip1 [Quercus suber]